jgi:hypothetical protein
MPIVSNEAINSTIGELQSDQLLQAHQFVATYKNITAQWVIWLHHFLLPTICILLTQCLSYDYSIAKFGVVVHF